MLSRVVGGAVSVKLKSWQQKIIMKAAPQQDIDRSIRAVLDRCPTASIQPPPPFELRYFATAMCQYTGDAARMFSHVRCLESKAHVYWSFELQEPFTPHQDMSAEQRNLYYFAHGSDTSGIDGMIRSRFIAPATIADGPEAVGHYSQATPWNDDGQCPVITQGYTSIPGAHFVLRAGGGEDAQQQCLIHGVVHFKRDHKYVMHSDRSTIAGFTVAVAKQFTALRDGSGRPLFQVPLTHAQQIQRGAAN